MKHTLSAILLAIVTTIAACGTEAQATSLHPDTFRDFSQVTVEADTKVIQVKLKGKFAVSCPGRQDFNAYWRQNGRINIDPDTSARDYLETIKSLLDKTSLRAVEKAEHQLSMGPQCLSFGYPDGVVFIDLGSSPLEVLELRAPMNFEITEINQLK